MQPFTHLQEQSIKAVSFPALLYLKPKSGKEQVLQTHLVIQKEKWDQEEKRGVIKLGENTFQRAMQGKMPWGIICIYH